jgi:hypothetical protein
MKEPSFKVYKSIRINLKKIKILIFHIKKLKNILCRCKLYIAIPYKKVKETLPVYVVYIYSYPIKKLRNNLFE